MLQTHRKLIVTTAAVSCPSPYMEKGDRGANPKDTYHYGALLSPSPSPVFNGYTMIMLGTVQQGGIC